MKRSNKKGFTIVELVIVIAIIAILAAVLIPTFASLIQKANTSADIQACREMNTFLAVNEVTGNKDITDVYAALKAGGMTAKDYRPLVSDRYFFWDSKLNRVLYTDKDNKVLYPDEYKDVTSKSDDTTNGNQWFSLSGKIDTSKAEFQTPANAPQDNDTYKAKSAADFVKIAEYIDKFKTQLKGKNITITIDDDINLNGADVCFNGGVGNNYLPNVTIEGNNHTITGLYISENHVGIGNNSAGTVSKTYGSAMFGFVNDLTVKNLTIDRAVVGSYEVGQCAIFAAHASGTVDISNVNIKNSTVYGRNKVGLLFGYLAKDNYQVNINTVTIENSKVYANQGECGLLFGAVTGSVQATLGTSKITLTSIVVDTSSANIAPGVEITTIAGKQYVYTGQNSNDQLGKYRSATAQFGFYGINQYEPKNMSGSGREGGTLYMTANYNNGNVWVTNWKPIDAEGTINQW